MRVAVISVVPTLGKSTLIEVLGGTFSRSQGRDVVVFTTGNANDNIDIITNTVPKNTHLDGPYVVKAMIENETENPKSLLNYGTQAGDERVFYYDILNAVMSDADKEEFLLNAIDRIPADLTLVEICGDVESELNKKVMNLCDCAIILVDTSTKCIKAYKDLMPKLPKGNMQLNVALVMSKVNPAVTSDKKFAEKIGKKTSDIYKFPYSPVLAKSAFDGELDRVIYNIIQADAEVVNLRMPMQELMEFMFNTPTRRVVRSIDRWYK